MNSMWHKLENSVFNTKMLFRDKMSNADFSKKVLNEPTEHHTVVLLTILLLSLMKVYRRSN